MNSVSHDDTLNQLEKNIKELHKRNILPVSEDRLTLLDNVLVDQVGASELLNIPAATLQKWRSTGEVGLPFIKIGHGVRYNTADLREWIENNTCHKPKKGEKV